LFGAFWRATELLAGSTPMIGNPAIGDACAVGLPNAHRSKPPIRSSGGLQPYAIS
jgi:hypothetical protein